MEIAANSILFVLKKYQILLLRNVPILSSFKAVQTKDCHSKLDRESKVGNVNKPEIAWKVLEVVLQVSIRYMREYARKRDRLQGTTSLYGDCKIFDTLVT